MIVVEKAESFDFGHGKSTIQLVHGESDGAVRLWNGHPQSWWNVPTHPAFNGMVEKCYEHMLESERRLHTLRTE